MIFIRWCLLLCSNSTTYYINIWCLIQKQSWGFDLDAFGKVHITVLPCLPIWKTKCFTYKRNERNKDCIIIKWILMILSNLFHTMNGVLILSVTKRKILTTKCNTKLSLIVAFFIKLRHEGNLRNVVFFDRTKNHCF